MRFVIVTGMSGAGKQTAMKMLEDLEFYCVDNLPLPMIEPFMELIAAPGSEYRKVALGLDVRADIIRREMEMLRSGEKKDPTDFSEAEKILENLRKKGYNYELIFMDASDETLIKRYKETRRMHPLSNGESIEAGIEREKKILRNVKKQANYIFDTSHLLTRELKVELEKIFNENGTFSNLIIRIVSFGFKHGIPADADLVFDVRFLPNPFYIPELKPLTGNNTPVSEYVMSFPEAGEFMEHLTEMLQFLIPNYVKEGKHQLVIGIGCTGGKHRSVTLANELYRRLKEEGKYGLTLFHRDEKI